MYLLNRLGRFLSCDGDDDGSLICNEKSFDVGVNSFAFVVISNLVTLKD
ncbi:MAG: hypothetical protein ACYTXC_03080 [Nostoc sp.]